MLFSIKGKTALVTGANRGIGRAIAKGYAESGANIIIIDREISAETTEAIRACGVNCWDYIYDLTNLDSIPALVDSIVDTCGGIDILYNNAGVQARHPSVDFPREDWDFVMDVNCGAVFLLCQAVGRHMIKKGYGKIINAASLLSFQGGFTVPAYAASKGAVAQFTKSLSNEWAALGININCIAPGYFDTDLNTAILNDPERSNQILSRIPAGRWGAPRDVVGAAIFLASAASDYVNGIVITVDGGWLGR